MKARVDYENDFCFCTSKIGRFVFLMRVTMMIDEVMLTGLNKIWAEVV